MSPVTSWTAPSSTPAGTETRWVVAPAASTALRGSSSSTCSTPLAASTAIRLPVSSAMLRSCPVRPVGETRPRLFGGDHLRGPRRVLAAGPAPVPRGGGPAARGDRGPRGGGGGGRAE